MRENDDEEGGYYSDVLDRQENAMVRRVGDQLGYGRLMNLARDIWRDILSTAGIEGGEFSVGPCVAMTVPCECLIDEHDSCDWCCGSGWLTSHVKAIKNIRTRGTCQCGAQRDTERLDNGVTHSFCPKCNEQDYWSE